MRTVQEYLKEMDEERIMGEYFYTHPIKYEELKDITNLSVAEVKERIRNNFRAYIKRLQNLKIEPSEDGKTYLLYVRKIIKDGFEEAGYSLICMQELMEKGNSAVDYSYIFSKQEEIMGFLVADTNYTQSNLYGLIADVLWEASFFGFEQEHLGEEREKLDASIKETDEGTCVTYSMDEVREQLGLEKEEEDELADKLRNKTIEAIGAFEKYCREKELNKIKQILQ